MPPATRKSARHHTGVEATKEVRVASPRNTRATRQNRSGTAAGEAEVSGSSTRKVSSIARRSAKPSVARSVASIATSVIGGDSDSEVGEAEEVNGGDDVDEDIVSQLEIERVESEASPFHGNAPDAEVMVEMRTDLYEAVKKLYAHLCIDNRNSTLYAPRLDGYRALFNTLKGLYSTEKPLFLDRVSIDDALVGQFPDASVLSVSHIVSAANLVILMDYTQAGKDEALHLFRVLDELFPRCIMAPDSVIADSYEEHQTFNRALDIRISLWVLQITDAFTGEAAMELGYMLLFGVSKVFPQQIDSKTVEFLPIDGVQFDEPDVEDEAQRKMRKTIFREFKRVSAFITKRGVNLKGLQEAFPIDTCLTKLFEWAKGLFGEVVKTIEQESARPATNDPEDVQEESTHSGLGGVLAIKRALAMGDGAAPVRDAGSRKRPRYEDGDEGDGDNFHPGGYEDGLDDVPVGPVRKRLKHRAPRTRPGREAEPNRTDRQVTADAPPRRSHTPSERASPSIRSASTRSDRQDTADVPPRGSHAASERASPPIRSVAPRPVPVPRERQGRTSWDNHDEQIVKYLVQIFGCGYRDMAKALREEQVHRVGEREVQMRFNVKRTPEQVRLKGRSMKVVILESDPAEKLPENFDEVALGNKEVQRIISKGKNPWRRECHVYDDGYPGNTKWVDGLTQEWSDGWTAEEGLPEATE